MYRTLVTFSLTALRCGKEYYPDSSLRHVKKIEAAYKLYKYARQGTHTGIMIVGRLKAEGQGPDEQIILVPDDQFAPGIDEALRKSLGILTDEFKSTGSILSSNNWSLLGNDAWVLGGIETSTPFHYASPLTWENFWDQEHDRMTVMARETLGLTAFGYWLDRPHPDFEVIAFCQNEKKAKDADLSHYKERVEEYITPDMLRRFWESLPEKVRTQPKPTVSASRS